LLISLMHLNDSGMQTQFHSEIWVCILSIKICISIMVFYCPAIPANLTSTIIVLLCLSNFSNSSAQMIHAFSSLSTDYRHIDINSPYCNSSENGCSEMLISSPGYVFGNGVTMSPEGNLF
jgi:hypothetical protein